MTILITGAAGFIGFHVANQLLNRGETVIGVDNINHYYDPKLKFARLEQLQTHKNFTFYRLDIADHSAMEVLIKRHTTITKIIHLAAQVGANHSMENPYSYLHSNLAGQLVILEMCRHLPKLEHLVYASSSAVYGGNSMLPFSVRDEVRKPLSLYASTKISAEMMTYSYSHLYHIPATGVRLFTVYGPFGRPDMAVDLFASAITQGKPLRLYNRGEIRRDFIYIDDAVEGIINILSKAPLSRHDIAPHKIYNLASSQSESLQYLVSLLENEFERKAEIHWESMQITDMKETYADIKESVRDFQFNPVVMLEEGIHKFAEWYRHYHNISLPTKMTASTNKVTAPKRASVEAY